MGTETLDGPENVVSRRSFGQSGELIASIGIYAARYNFREVERTETRTNRVETVEGTPTGSCPLITSGDSGATSGCPGVRPPHPYQGL